MYIKIHFKMRTIKIYSTLFLKVMRGKMSYSQILAPKTLNTIHFNISKILTRQGRGEGEKGGGEERSNAKVTDKE